uniref:Ovule protein n=1 Tax=Strongyloides venezuelensis TaxID=75913 RepID=A0A0K0FGC4_STRVS
MKIKRIHVHTSPKIKLSLESISNTSFSSILLLHVIHVDKYSCQDKTLFWWQLLLRSIDKETRMPQT